MGSRKIIHIDMDAFFASVEQRDFPELRGKPIAVGGSEHRGVVAAASYEARKYGVRSAMPGIVAKRKCPSLIFVKHRFPVYREVSTQIRDIMSRYTDMIEPLSLDEAYLDVTENKQGYKSAIYMARKIKEEIFSETQLTASAGVSINKFLAKIASDLQKPNGLTVILPEEVEDFVARLSVEKFYGVGQATVEKMHQLRIFNGKDLREKDLFFLTRNFGRFGTYLHEVARGIDNRPVKPDRVRKSISIERTFSQDLRIKSEIKAKIDELSKKLGETLTRKQIRGKTIQLKFRYEDFTTLTRSKSVASFLNDSSQIAAIAWELVIPLLEEKKGVRLLGVGMSNLENQKNTRQLTLDF